MDTVITALIVFGALIYMRIHNHSHADYDEDNPKGFDVRAFIFPIHYFIRSTIFTIKVTVLHSFLYFLPADTLYY